MKYIVTFYKEFTIETNNGEKAIKMAKKEFSKETPLWRFEIDRIFKIKLFKKRRK